MTELSKSDIEFYQDEICEAKNDTCKYYGVPRDTYANLAKTILSLDKIIKLRNKTILELEQKKPVVENKIIYRKR